MMHRLLFTTLLAAVATASLVNENGEPCTPEVADGYELDENGMSILQENIPESRQALTLGTIGPNDRLMARITHNVGATSFVIHDQDVAFHGVEFTNITAIRVLRNGSTQNAVPSIRAGGLWHDYVIVRIRGAMGRGFDYTIQVYASINCSNS